MPPSQQQAGNSANTPNTSTVTSLPASALKHLEPTPGGQWMCREYQDSLHVAYNVVGGLGTYHYLINPCTTEDQVRQHCQGHVYDFPGIQRNHEEIQRYEFPDKFSTSTRATPTMQISLEPQVLSLNNSTQEFDNAQTGIAGQGNSPVTTFKTVQNEEKAPPDSRSTISQLNSSFVADSPFTKAVDETTQQLFENGVAANSTNWSLRDETTLPPAPESSGDAQMLHVDSMYAGGTWTGAWTGTENTDSVGGDIGWLMNGPQ